MIDSKDAVRNLYPPAKEGSVRKQIAYRCRHCLRFIALSPFVVMASAGGEGLCDASPRG